MQETILISFAGNNSDINVGGDLIISHDADYNVDHKIDDRSTLTIDGDLIASGHKFEGSWSKENNDEFHRVQLYATGQNSSIVVNGDVDLTDNAHVFTQSYENSVLSEDHDNFVEVAESLRSRSYFNNVSVKENAKFGAYSAGIASVSGDVSAQSGGHIDASVSDAKINIDGNVSLADYNTQVSASHNSSVYIAKNVNVSNHAKISAYDNSIVKVSGNTELNNGRIEADKNSQLNFNNLYISNVSKNILWHNIGDGSALAVSGDMTMSGVFIPGEYIPVLEADQNFYLNNLFVNGENSNLDVQGNVKLTGS